MPWIINENGERVYRPSIYCKDELPTWDEVYDEYYLKYFHSRDNIFYFIPRTPILHEMDPYWNVPRKLFILAMVCNQFNKMVVEDDYHQKLLEFINSDGFDMGIDDYPVDCVKFVLCTKTNPNNALGMWDTNVSIQDQVPVYAFKLPNGESSPYIINNHPREYISDKVITWQADVTIGILIGSLNHDSSVLLVPLDIGEPVPSSENFNKIIEFLMRPYVEYFENGVGWKDEDGKLIEGSRSARECQGVGSDPAL